MAQVETRLDPLARSLALFRPQRGVSSSLFLDLDASVVPTATEVRRHAASVVDSARRRLDRLSAGLAHDELVAAREDLDRADTFFEDDLDRAGAEGLALYVSGLDDLWQTVALPMSVPDEAYVGRRLALAPILESLARDRELLLVAVGRERGTIWRARNGRTELVEDRTQEIGRRHDQGGWSQARLQRSVDEDALEHFREVADTLAHVIQPGSGILLLVACVEEQRSTFEEMLAKHVRDALLGWSAVEAHSGPEALRPDADRLLAGRLVREETAFLDRWRETLAGGDRATASWRDALEAAAHAAIDTVLVDGRTREAWICPSCDRGSLEDGRCPLDGTPLVHEPGGALEIVVRGTLGNGGQVRRVNRLDGADGVAAILRFPVAAPPEPG